MTSVFSIRMAHAPRVLRVLLLFPILCASVHAQTDEDKYSQKDLLKSWALSYCLAQVYADPIVKADAEATASTYLERGNQGIGAYEHLAELVKKYAALELTGSIPSSFNTMKCIRLFNSKELDLLTGQLVTSYR